MEAQNRTGEGIAEDPVPVITIRVWLKPGLPGLLHEYISVQKFSIWNA
jgi:hypothetical protein